MVSKPKNDNRKGGSNLNKKEQTRLKREISAAEAEIAQIDIDIEQSVTDHTKLTELFALKEQKEEMLMELMEKWEEVSSFLEDE